MLPIVAMLLAPLPQSPLACPMGPNWGGRAPLGLAHNTLSMADGPLTWNGAPVSQKVLRQYLAVAATLSPRPPLVVDTAGMDCPTRRRIAAEADAAGSCTPTLCQAYDVVRGSPPPAPPAAGSSRYRRR